MQHEVIDNSHRHRLEAVCGIVFTTLEWDQIRYSLHLVFSPDPSKSVLGREPLSASEGDVLTSIVEAGTSFSKAMAAVDEHLEAKMRHHGLTGRIVIQPTGRLHPVAQVSKLVEIASATLDNHKKKRSGERYKARQIEGLRRLRSLHKLATHRSTRPAPYREFLRELLTCIPDGLLAVLSDRQPDSIIDYATKRVMSEDWRPENFQCAEINEAIAALMADGPKRVERLEQYRPGVWKATLSDSPSKFVEFETQYTGEIDLLYKFTRQRDRYSHTDAMYCDAPSTPRRMDNNGWDLTPRAEEWAFAFSELALRYGKPVADNAHSEVLKHGYWVIPYEARETAAYVMASAASAQFRHHRVLALLKSGADHASDDSMHRSFTGVNNRVDDNFKR